jgi:hypothetical protein
MDPDYGILPEKREAEQDILWKISLYSHVVAGVVVLAIPLISFLGKKCNISTRIHALVGNWYVKLGLYLILPTGIYLALYAKGGLATQIGFLAQALAFGFFTWQGWRAAQNGQMTLHRNAMIRSYAMMAAVLSFRLLHILFFFVQIPYEQNYAMSQWMSLLLNSFLAELAIVWITSLKNTSKTNSTHRFTSNHSIV